MGSTSTRRIAVFGAGVMGVGITALAVGSGVPVVLVDVDPAKLATARERVRTELRLAHMMGALPRNGPVGELVTTGSVADAASATAVIEAITESAELKIKLQNEIAGIVAAGTVRISNTSSIPIGEIAAQVTRPEHLAGIHFMNPPYLIKTVEVIRGPNTGEQAMAAVAELLAGLNRRPIVVGDGPGFVTSRVLHRMINEAARVVEEGRASAEDVDALMEGCLGHPTGPLKTADLIGIDNLVDSLRVLHERTGDEASRPCDLLLRLVDAGDLGRKSGRGFYEYAGA
ncbi:3-hydroxyacyl-CoA dehydrogenase family protein [Sphaerisporangium sp. TRM90804]|uniref:3-hydroxyacyl-CoA dehydrogenase family protein n=1 Tax=Sphaerisporangium sp. TRM90804 TaxID=3031113 RepID=UPI0024487388|nr:3-hydroxyacyl-CoA dehydrogenase family protein [Sphaerisporangium sp. TRM90804]MDH2428418.1 3-hydroxyacyl-CoA dehydrogenase family protein [Sphaerisporangium sp. TRM90804]